MNEKLTETVVTVREMVRIKENARDLYLATRDRMNPEVYFWGLIIGVLRGQEFPLNSEQTHPEFGLTMTIDVSGSEIHFNDQKIRHLTLPVNLIDIVKQEKKYA
jgi:hypothetical protein